MRRALTWLSIAVLCCAAAAPAGPPPLEQARSAYAQARKSYERGRYSDALNQGERALALWEAARQGTHPEAAGCLDLLGVLHQLQGDAAGAESLLRRGLEAREAALGKGHPDVAVSLDHLASLYKEQGAHEHAAPLYERALAIQEEARGKDHPDAAAVLNNLASLYLDQGAYAKAGPLTLRALSIQYKSLGRKHPAVVSTLDNFARVQAWQGNLDQARKNYELALKLVEDTQGRNHPRVADLLNGLARVRLQEGRVEEALSPLRRAFAISELRLRREALDFSESRLSGFVAHLRAQEDLIYELARSAPLHEDVRHLALTAALLRKGRSVEQLAETSRTAYQRVSARDREALAKLRGLRSELAGLSLQGPGALPPADYRQRLKDLTRQGDALEAELARRSAPLRALTSLPRPEDMVAQVADALPDDGMLVELVAYLDRGSLRKPGASPPPAPVLRYLALVLLPDERTTVVDLGEAAVIDSAAARMRDALARRDAAFLSATQELYQRVLRPVWRLLSRTEKVYLSADGQLALVPFAALHDGHQYLVDAYDFTYLNSGRDLLPRTKEVVPAQSVVVLADPDFQAPAPGSAAPEVASRPASVERSLSRVRADVAELPWTPLPGTRAEAEAIHRLFPRAQLFLGREATKARLLQVSAPGVLHLATHGFFLEDAEAPASTRAVGHFGALSEPSRAATPEDPLLRSGLILAGTREGAARGDPVVTALELAGLNLWGTQLVVLSACDTGRGDVKLGQGVYGLRRAFVAAGAETVVMSLWKVDDAVTRVLMEGYYRNLLAGRGRATALRGAMRALRRTHPHPHYWAPFIAVGQDAPLRVLPHGLPPVR